MDISDLNINKCLHTRDLCGFICIIYNLNIRSFITLVFALDYVPPR